MIFLRNYYVNSTKNTDVFLITHDVKRAVRESGIESGLITVLIPGGGAGVALMEEDPKIHQEFRELVENQIPETGGGPGLAVGQGAGEIRPILGQPW